LGVVVLIVLVAAWAAFLVPQIVRARSDHRPSGSISDFRKQLHVLARTSPNAPGRADVHGLAPGRIVPIRPLGRPVAPGVAVTPLRLGRNRATIKRRRDVLVGLLVAMAGSLVLGVLPPLRALWALHVVIDLLFVAYVGALVYLRNLAAERELKVRFLPSTVSAPEPALLYRRSAN
jgi:hypothetical protein